MNILITGGAGFIGSNVSRELVQAGHRVRVFDNLSSGYSENLDGLDLEFVQGDIRDLNSISDACIGMDCVFHLAASVGNVKSIEDPFYDLECNYTGTLNLIQGIRKHSVPRIVYSSSAATYGEPNYLPIDENHLLTPDSPYGVSKMAAEKLLHAFAKIAGFTAISLRYFNAYGENQRYDAYGNVIPIFFNRILSGLPLVVYGDGEQTRDFVNVRDIVQANVLALNCETSAILNVATGNSCSVNNLIDIIQNATERKLQIEYKEARKGEVLHSASQIDRATKTIGFVPSISLQDGIKDYSEWFFNTFAASE